MIPIVKNSKFNVGINPHQHVVVPPLPFFQLCGMEKINLAIVEDDPLIRESLENFLTEHPSVKIGLIAKSMEEFLEAIKDAASRPTLDLMLLDIELPGMSGIQGIYHIKQ